MRRLIAALSMLGVATATTLLATPASAAPSTGLAGEYPVCTDVKLTLDLSKIEVVGGSSVTITAAATSGNTPPVGTLTVRAFGKTYTDDSTELSVTVDTPEVSEESVRTIRARFVGTLADGLPCEVTSGGVSSADTVSEVASTTITLLPRGLDDEDEADSSSLLPDTGGARLALLLVGLALVAGGVSFVARGRRGQHV